MREGTVPRAVPQVAVVVVVAAADADVDADADADVIVVAVVVDSILDGSATETALAEPVALHGEEHPRNGCPRDDKEKQRKMKTEENSPPPVPSLCFL
jgi:hypothetical protein